MIKAQLSMFKALALSGLLAGAPFFAVASGFEPVTLAPITHQVAELTVIDKAGETHTYTPAQLEEFPTYRLTTVTPWRDSPAVFEGILLSDLLVRHNLDAEGAIQVLAENDYLSDLERAVWAADAILIATRVDGKAHLRRARGPIQFVSPADVYLETGFMRESHLVWMAHTIQPVP